MNLSPRRATFAVIFALTVLSPAFAQQQVPPSASPQQPPTPSAVAPSVTAPAVSETAAPSAENDSRSLKSTAAVPRDMSPWSMFMSADVLVKAVMIGLVFASLL